MTNCQHRLPTLKRLYVHTGAAAQCLECGKYVYPSRLISGSIFSGVAAFLFIPFALLLIVVGELRWYFASAVAALLFILYLYESLSGALKLDST